eukprot:CAMPEP_0176138108 /NCGR_PEP_ID=MMETSP0120_2-20121206/70145_1 /TAXON_ID=160619 /ORGANISM="Kryptoperidinium foliaceum, Strain CCMP 1326" /LENGTH=56 /DNA_ID=CAMNT_0017474023 /DNA_START=38 /DNA_END=204 /DNA_ORIENTATION=+
MPIPVSSLVRPSGASTVSARMPPAAKRLPRAAFARSPLPPKPPSAANDLAEAEAAP